jgi:peptidoglycan biosynthesis protein MviN/MurJ (putative lipid II flippase)
LFYGRFYAQRHQFTARSLTEFAGISLAATTVAFLISNISFYLFAEYFSEVTTLQYAQQLTQYFSPYLQGAFLYLIPAAVLHIVAVQATRGVAQKI